MHGTAPSPAYGNVCMYVPRGSIDRVAASHSAVEVDGVSEAGSDEAEEDVEVRAREPVRVAELAVGHVLDDDLLPIDVLKANGWHRPVNLARGWPSIGLAVYLFALQQFDRKFKL